MMSAGQSPLCDAKELARLAKNADGEALERATRCFGQRLIALGRRHCRSEEEAEDAVQDALISAGTHLESYRGEAKLQSWLSRMVINACHRMRRGRKNDPAMHATDEELTSSEADPEDAAGRAELAGLLSDALLSLPARDRAIVLLTDVEGWKAPEVASELGMSPGSVRSRLSRARARLRSELESARVFSPGD